MASNKLEDCVPELVKKFNQVKVWFESNLPKWGLRIDQTLRSDEEQLDAYLSGHSELDPRIPDERARCMHLATKSGKSRAIDVTIFSRSSGRSADKLLALGALSQDSYDLLYLTYMLFVERAGLRSGNDWNQNAIAVGPDKAEKFFDGGHAEITGG